MWMLGDGGSCLKIQFALKKYEHMSYRQTFHSGKWKEKKYIKVFGLQKGIPKPAFPDDVQISY